METEAGHILGRFPSHFAYPFSSLGHRRIGGGHPFSEMEVGGGGKGGELNGRWPASEAMEEDTFLLPPRNKQPNWLEG